MHSTCELEWPYSYRWTRRTRKERAIAVRDRALNILKQRGCWQSTKHCKVLVCRIADVEILHRTPFQTLPKAPDRKKYQRALLQGKENLPYGLDVWEKGKKVMNLEWSGSKIQLISFRPGAWEALILVVSKQLSFADPAESPSVMTE